MATHYSKEIKLNPDYVASDRLIIKATRYRGTEKRWTVELWSGFHSYRPFDFMIGTRREAKDFIKKHITQPA